MVRKMIRFGLILMVICLAASLVLSLSYKLTKPYIEAQEESEKKEALLAVLTGIETYEEKKIDEIDYYECFSKNKERLGYILNVEAKGYSGPIEMMVGVDVRGKIKGLKVLEQKETPGLGNKIVEILPQEKDSWFLRQFEGKGIKELDLSHIQAITGATISSKAVVDGVRETIDNFLERLRDK